MGLLDSIKNDVKKSGKNKSKIAYFREGEKKRIRFLNDMEEGMELVFHDSYENGINVVCKEHYGKYCEYCEQEGLRTRNQYVWSVWDYEAKEVKLFLFPVNNCSPIPALMAMYETYGTITDRDYVFTVTGKAQNKSFSVVPMDKQKFRNEKAKPFSESKILSILAKAFPDDNEDEEEEDYEEETPKKKKGNKKPAKPVVDEDDDWDDEEEANDYEDMSPKELYKLCKERDIECKPKKNAKYYIAILEDYDKAHDDWDDEEDDEDEWEDE